ncbi:MAG: phosphatase PAP2 family protein [Steroidobacteraceae bacterium]
MGYLKLLRVRLALAVFAAVSLLFLIFPDIDLSVSHLFFHSGRFPLQDAWWTQLLHFSVGYFILVLMIGVLAVYVVNRLRNSELLDVDGRVVSYLFLVLIVGAGGIVNLALKDNFGRARPRDITEFGGTKQFTPAYVISDQCAKNCSFSSGDAAGAFFMIALARALSRSRRALAAAVAFGLLVSAARIVSGAHFLSDTIVSFFIMFFVGDVLYYYLIAPGWAPRTAAAIEVPES